MHIEVISHDKIDFCIHFWYTASFDPLLGSLGFKRGSKGAQLGQKLSAGVKRGTKRVKNFSVVNKNTYTHAHKNTHSHKHTGHVTEYSNPELNSYSQASAVKVRLEGTG